MTATSLRSFDHMKLVCMNMFFTFSTTPRTIGSKVALTPLSSMICFAIRIDPGDGLAAAAGLATPIAAKATRATTALRTKRRDIIGALLEVESGPLDETYPVR